MPTFYVSQTATNGYAVGSDANNGTTKALATLTIQAAHTLASTGDTIMINEGNYAEVVAVTKGVAFLPEVDYTVTISGTGTPANIVTTSLAGLATVTFGKLTIDGETIGSTGSAINCGSGTKTHNVTFLGTRIICGALYGVRDQLTTGSTTMIGGEIIKTTGTGATVGFNSVLAHSAGSTVSITDTYFNLVFNNGASACKAVWILMDSTVGNGTTMNCVFKYNRVFMNNTNASLASNYIGVHIQNTTTYDVAYNYFDINATGSGSIVCLALTPYMYPENTGTTYDARAMTGNVHHNTAINRGTAGLNIMIGNDGFISSMEDKMNDADVYANYIECTSRATTTHGLLYGQNTGGRMYGNFAYNVPLGFIMKGQDGGIMSGNIAYNDIATGGQYGSLRIKGSQNTLVTNNTVVNTANTSYVGNIGAIYQEDDLKPITLTSVTTTATGTASAHGYKTGQSITIRGATPSAYNGTYTITVTGANTFTYTFAGGTSPATGTIEATSRFGDATGIVWRNNIIVDLSTTPKPARTEDALQTATFETNNYYHPNGTPTYTYNGTNRASFALWQSNVEATATNVNPSFTAGYLLPSGSTLISSGTATDANARDYSGLAFNATPSIGAREISVYTLPGGDVSIQDTLNRIAGTTGLRNAEALRVITGRTTTSDTEQDGWNYWAGTRGLRIQDCVNLIAHTTGLRVQDAINLL